MYFIPRNNKVYATLVVTPLYRLYIASLCSTALLVTLWWMVLYAPLNERIQLMQRDYAAMTYQQSSYPQMTSEIQRLERVNQELTATVSRSLHERNLYSVTLDNILTKGIETGLNLISCVPEQPRDKGWYTLHRVDVRFSGSFDSVQAFLKSLALHDYPVRIQRLALAKQRAASLVVHCSFNLIGVHDDACTSV